MASMVGVLNRIPTAFNETKVAENLADAIAKAQAVTVEGNSTKINPQYMQLCRFYLVELDGEPYLYRKVSKHEVEIYGLAKNI